MSRKQWIALAGGVIILLLAGRMVLRYLDYQASQTVRQAADRSAG